MASSSVGPAVDATQLTARLDRLQIGTRTHRKWLWLLGFFCFFDCLDLAAFGYTAPAIREDWGLTVGQIGVGTSATFIGMFIGAIVGGRLADRIGRRRVIVGAVAVYSVASLLTAVSPSFEMLVAGRVLTGLGLQALLATLMVYMSEMFPPSKRGRYVSLVMALGLTGIPAIAFLSRLVVPLDPGAWRWIYVVGALGGLGLVVIRALPESTRWLISQGRAHEALPVIEQLEAEARAAGRLPEVLPSKTVARVAEAGSIRELVTTRAGVLLLVSSSFMLVILINYGFNNWVPTLMVERGFTTSESLMLSAILAVGSVPGAFIAYAFVDRWERKSVLLGMSVALAVTIGVFGFSDQVPTMVVSGFLVSGLIQAQVVVMYTYGPELFPTHIRGIAIGVAGGTARFAGIISSLAIAAMVTAFGFASVFGYLVLLCALLGVIVQVFGPRTYGKTLTEGAATDGAQGPVVSGSEDRAENVSSAN